TDPLAGEPREEDLRESDRIFTRPRCGGFRRGSLERRFEAEAKDLHRAVVQGDGIGSEGEMLHALAAGPLEARCGLTHDGANLLGADRAIGDELGEVGAIDDTGD